jgi:hypothetical protein
VAGLLDDAYVGSQLSCDLDGPVGGPAVDDQDLEQAIGKPGHHHGEVLGLVQRRDDDADPWALQVAMGSIPVHRRTTRVMTVAADLPGVLHAKHPTLRG